MQKILVSTFTYHLVWFQILECAFADKKPVHCGVSVGTNTELGTTPGRDDVEQRV